MLNVWVGFKRRGNSILPGPALCFGVLEKHERVKDIRAAGSKPIPKVIEGVQTDIYSLKGTASAYWTSYRWTEAQDTLVGGCSTAPLTYSPLMGFPIHGGTLGGICYQGGELMAISNGHVWGDRLGCEIAQPDLPLKQFGWAVLELLTCGPIPAYIATDSGPSL